MTDGPLSDTAQHMRAVLDEIAAGGIRCSAATRHRLEGAVIAVEALAAGDVVDLAGRLTNDRLPDESG